MTLSNYDKIVKSKILCINKKSEVQVVGYTISSVIFRTSQA